MDRKQLGVGLIVLGFLAAIVAGGWLAGQAAKAGAEAGDLVLAAGLLFVPVALLVGGGIYLFQRQMEHPAPESEVQMQRRLVDTMTAKGQVSIEELATILHISPGQVQALIEQLVALDIFPGEVDWDAGVVYAQDRKAAS